MKFIVSSTLLLKNLQSISGVLNSSNTLPILDNFLFDLTEEELVISASDLETTMSVRIKPDKAENPNRIAIPARILLDTLKTLPDIPVTFTINMDNKGIEISAGEGKYKLAGSNAEEFPKLPVLEDSSSLVIPAEVLGNAINKTIFATGTDELRPVMSGVFCELTTESVTFVATDAHKLVRYRRKDFQSTEDANFIIPKKPLNQLKNLLSNVDSEVKIEYNTTNAYFSFDNVNLICRLIEGKYPNYEAVIPTKNPNQLLVDRSSLIGCMRRVAIFANQSTHQVRFRVNGQELQLSAEDLDLANEAKERLACNYTGDELEIGFNSKFILDMLNNLDTENIKMEMSAPNRAGLILPDEEDMDENEDILMLVMPVMLNQ